MVALMKSRRISTAESFPRRLTKPRSHRAVARRRNFSSFRTRPAPFAGNPSQRHDSLLFCRLYSSQRSFANSISFSLTQFRAAAKQDYKPLNILAEVHPVTRPKIDPVFKDAAADTFDIREIAKSKAIEGCRHSPGCFRIQPIKPIGKRAEPIRLHVLADVNHSNYGNIYIPIETGTLRRAAARAPRRQFAATSGSGTLRYNSLNRPPVENSSSPGASYHYAG